MMNYILNQKDTEYFYLPPAILKAKMSDQEFNVMSELYRDFYAEEINDIDDFIEKANRQRRIHENQGVLL